MTSSTRVQLIIEPVDLALGPILIQMSDDGHIGAQRLARPPYRFRHWSRTLRTSSCRNELAAGRLAPKPSPYAVPMTFAAALPPINASRFQ